MKIFHIKKGCLVFFMILFNLPSSYGQATTGRFLLFTPSARSSAMGGVGVASDRSSYATYFNPSNLAFSPTLAASASFVKPLPFFGNVADSYFSLSTNLGNIGAIGASGHFYWKGIHFRTNSFSSDIIGATEITDWQLKLTYAHTISDQVAVGAGFGVLRLALADYGTENEKGEGKNTSVTVDLGIVAKGLLPFLSMSGAALGENAADGSVGQKRDERGVSLGLVLRNLGPKVSMIDAQQADPISSVLSLGLSYALLSSTRVGILLACDLENRIYEESFVDYIHWGGEIQLFRIAFLRAGYYQDTSGPKNSYATWGCGITLYGLNVNIARYQQALVPVWHIDGTFSWEML